MIYSLKSKILLSLRIVIFLYILIFLSNTGICEDKKEFNKNKTWHISAESITYDNKKQLYIAEKNVLITREQTRLEADYAEFSELTQDVLAKGNVVLISGEDLISCDTFNMNLARHTGIIGKGTIFIKKENFYLTGEGIEKTGESTYKVEQGSLTSCSGENPDWKISGQDINVQIEGYGTAKNVVFWAKQIPAVYSPYLFFPVKTKRQTGLLTPKLSFSQRKGAQYEQALFIALNKSTDATVYTDYMAKRGLKTGLEYRYVMDKYSKGAVFLDYLQDRKIDDGTEKTKDFSFQETAQRTNTDRYWFRMKHDQRLPYGLTGKLDVDVVSDADYLFEFKNGLSGFEKTNKYFEEQFGQSIDDKDVTLRKNRLSLSKGWSNYLFSSEILWYDNIVTKQNNQADTTLQTLPAVNFNLLRQQIGSTPLYYNFDSEYKYFYRKDTTTNLVNGHRTDFHPMFYIPMRLKKNFQFEPYLGVRATSWYTDDFTSSDGNSDNLRTRLIADTGAQLSTKMFRVFNTNNSFADKIKHELIPKLEYSFIPDMDQNDLPEFDTLDRIGKQNLLTWSLTNYLISGKTSYSKDREKMYGYNDFAYIKLYQSFDIDKQKEGDSEPFSDFYFTARFSPNNIFSINTDFAYSPYDNQFTQYNIGGTIKGKRGDMLTSEYRYTRDNFETLYSEISVILKNRGTKVYKNGSSDSSYGNYEIKPELTVNSSIEVNLRNHETLETQVGLIWNKECWSFELSRSESEGDVSVGFTINLYGLGSL